MSSVVWFYCMLPYALGLPVLCKAVINKTIAKVPLARVVWIRLAAAEFRRVHFEKLLAERCLSSYCWVVSYLCFDTLWNFFASLPRTGTLLFNVGHLSERVVSTWTSLLIVRHLLEPWCIVVNAGVQRGPSARRSPGVSWNVNESVAGSYRLIWSGRTVLSDLECCTRTRRQNSSSRYFSSLLVEVRVCQSTSEDR